MDTTTITYNCPNCGAGLEFDAEKQKFCCEFCLSEFTEEEAKAANPEDSAKEQESARQEYNENMNEYECPSCGAHVIADKDTVASTCYYCHNPIVLVGRLSGQMKPDRIVPFKYDKEAAEEQFLKFAKKKWFVPKGFFCKAQADKITGVYYPFWLTDADTNSSVDAVATKVKVWRTGNVEYTKTSNYNVTRSGDIHFEDITTSAYSQADKDMLEGILPFPIDSLKEFSMPYLSGFQAKKRDIERANLTGEVRARMNTYAKQLLGNTISGYNTVNVQNINVNVHKSNWEYSLMPVWVLTYKNRRGKNYTYAMNGYTGKIYGELPISYGKLSILLASCAAAFTALFTIIGGMIF